MWTIERTEEILEWIAQLDDAYLDKKEKKNGTKK